MHFSTWQLSLSPALLAFYLTTSIAQLPAPDVHEHIRSTDPLVRLLFTQGHQASPSFRELVAAIEASDVIVHVERRSMCAQRLVGMTRFVTAAPGARYVRVSLERTLTGADAAAVLAHELQHVVEIARAVWVVDDGGVRRLFESIGYRTGYGDQRYDTDDAIAIGRRTWPEVQSANGHARLNLR